MRKAYSYIRFSTPDQAKGDSFRRQSEFAKRYCEEKGLTLDTTLKLSDLGISAFKGDNVRTGALAGFLEAVTAGRIPKGSVLILESLDRLSRNQLNTAHRLFTSILEAGVHIVTCNPEREYTPADLNDLIGTVEPLLYFFRAHEESATKSKRVSESWNSRRKKAEEDQTPMTTVGPQWLRLVEGRWQEIPDRMKVVRSLFRWCVEGMGTYAIVQKLNKEKVPAFGKSKKWNTSYCRLILTDRRSVGEYQPKKLIEGKMQPVGDPIPNYYPAAVTEEQFYAALGKIKGRKRKAGRGGSGSDNLATGLWWNAADQTKLYIGVDQHRRDRVLDSSGPLTGGTAPKGRSFKYEPLENALLSVLEELDVRDFNPATTKAATKEKLDAATGRLKETEELLTETKSRLRQTRGKTLLDLISELEEDKANLEVEIGLLRSELADKRNTLEETQDAIQLLRQAKGEERETLKRKIKAGVDELVESIWLYIEVFRRVKKVAHMQVFFKNGKSRYRTVMYPAAAFDELEQMCGDYSKVDLRQMVRSDKTQSKKSQSPSQSTQRRRRQ